MFKGKSLYVISAVSLLGIGANIDVQILLTCYWSNLNKKGLAHFWIWTQRTQCGSTPNGIWKHASMVCIQTLMHWAMHGHLAEKKVYCKALPWQMGTLQVPWIVKGDLEYYANLFGL